MKSAVTTAGEATAPGQAIAKDQANWTLARHADGLTWLSFDCAGAAANTLSAATLDEFAVMLDALGRDPPRGLVIRSGKANGFIAGADVAEFRTIHD
ncbi:MAG: hypothetical protein ACREX6_12260, partial [Casimicrobiaceae bacterium]